MQWKFTNNIPGRVRRWDESVSVSTPSAQSDRSSETNGKDEWNRLKDQLKPLLIEDGGLSSIQSGEIRTFSSIFSHSNKVKTAFLKATKCQ